MKMAFILFDGMTTLDFAGFYEAVTWMGILKGKEFLSWDFCSNQPQIAEDRGLTVKIDRGGVDPRRGGLSGREEGDDESFGL
ncbi:hypothetical protein [Paenibacillus arenilitoris]|uniref:hypothetical protein n=1 Tax=Paenibacillus arenilitoris TaxID=2772299 RepID=UPI00295B580B|nr:hypothetical protein [Paenibacillus arenilitoris]